MNPDTRRKKNIMGRINIFGSELFPFGRNPYMKLKNDMNAIVNVPFAIIFLLASN
jgi:hypothetical protein